MRKTRLRPLLIASVAAFALIGAFTFKAIVPISYAAEEHGDAHGHAEGEENHDKGEEKHGHGHDEAVEGKPAEASHGEEGHSEEGHAEEGKAEEGHSEGEDGHGHEEGGEGGEAIKINESYNEEFKIRTEKAASGKLDMAVELPGEVKVNRDRTARIVARVPGVVREAPANLGDTVKAGDVLALLESRDLAEAKAAYLAAAERLKLAKENFDRETDLKKQGVTSEQDYQNARTDHAQASIEFQNAKQGLEALGLSAEQGEKTGPKESLSRYAITAPFDGTVISKNVGIGDTLEEGMEEEAFTVSDMSTLWLDIAVYQKDMNAVQAGQKVIVTPQFGN
ncbi:MAG: efflux RND transporter periplasmic adaptor subunit, partial [Alphaproteobacteria bacterium]|nr:efflux RND transporter periplasmic adaptor subunit [Alphaproteobacteria bacterium]